MKAVAELAPQVGTAPASPHRVNQRWTALLLQNTAGRSFHVAPLSSIQKMP